MHAEKSQFRGMLRHHSTSCRCLEIPEDASALLSGFKIDQRKPKIFNLKQKTLFLKSRRCYLTTETKKDVKKSNKAEWVFPYFCIISHNNILVMITINVMAYICLSKQFFLSWVPISFADISHSSTFNLHMGCLFSKRIITLKKWYS